MAITPMMQQFLDAKQQHPDSLLLFRMGDFYELFQDDAVEAAKVLGLALTSRDKGPNATPMAGFPHHSLEPHLVKLVELGYRVAICDQVEDPKHAKGLVQREVTRVITPGTLTDEALLRPDHNNYLAAVMFHQKQCGIAWIDISTGDFTVCDHPIESLADEIARIEPAECLVPEDISTNILATCGFEMIDSLVTHRPDWNFNARQARETLLRQLSVATLEGFGIPDGALSICAAGAIVHYLNETQKTSLDHLLRIKWYQPKNILLIDQVTRRSLELVRTMREGKREGSLLSVLDRTTTAMGSRKLAQWVGNPLADRDQIRVRHEAVEEFVQAAPLRRDLRTHMGKCYDIERLTSRIATRRASPRDLGCLASTLSLVPSLKRRLVSCTSDLLKSLESMISPCEELCEALNAALVDSPPVVLRDGGVIRSGFNAELDELREIGKGGKQWIAEFQASEIKRTGISSLKVGFNRVFGYYIEITNAHGDKVPPEYTRKQTLKNAERYITEELKVYEEKVLRAEERSLDLELEVFGQLRELAAAETARLQFTADSLATIDVLMSFSEVAEAKNYSRPELSDEPILEVTDGRHPVIESFGAAGEFVPNDISLSCDDGQVMIVTGPNMAGKSTYIRQTALMIIMAQIGSFVPARKALVGLCDRVFARVGASDELARGQSTFMVEMVETAHILNSATAHSLVILDEIGRGTSTYDGVSLAWAVAEYLHDSIHCRVLFATHYHELAELARGLDRARNLNVAVREWEDEIVFLHKILEGAADKSYGIHVARLAGVPKPVIERAKTVLSELEAVHLNLEGHSRLEAKTSRRSSFIQRSLFWGKHDAEVDQIRNLDLNSMSAEEIVAVVSDIQKRLE